MQQCMELTGTNRSRAYPLRSGRKTGRSGWKMEECAVLKVQGREQESGDWCLFFFYLQNNKERF